MWTNSIIATLILAVIGLGSGAAIAAGIFALITKIGVLTQIAHRTKTGKYVTIYETAVCCGGVMGTLLTIFHFQFPQSKCIKIIAQTPVFVKYFKGFCQINTKNIY